MKAYLRSLLIAGMVEAPLAFLTAVMTLSGHKDSFFTTVLLALQFSASVPLYALELALERKGIYLLAESPFAYYGTLFVIQTLLLSVAIHLVRIFLRKSPSTSPVPGK